MPIPTTTPAHQPWLKPMPSSAKSYTPTHPGLFHVEFASSASSGDDGYSSCLIAEKDFPPNTIITTLQNITLAPRKAYSSVQFGPLPGDHLELNSDLLFVNHSCNPNTGFDLSAPTPFPTPSPSSSSSGVVVPEYPVQWHLKTLAQGLKKGEMMTFFYPSTEWEMDQPFACNCGESSCLGEIAGAKHLEKGVLEGRGWVNGHILGMKDAATVVAGGGD